VDVGGTKTRVTSDTIDFRFPTDADALPNKLRSWLRQRPRFDELVVGARGVWTAAEKNAWKKKLRPFAKRVSVLSDIELAHRRFFGKTAPGVLLNGGTGSIAFGRNQQGRTARAGGMGTLMGDEGSGFWIGRSWIKSRYERSGDWRRVRVYAKRPDAVRALAALAKGVLRRAAKQPKSLERRVGKAAAEQLAALVWDVRRRLRMNPETPLCFTGGLFENEWFKKEVLKCVY
jgi:N-acetylglucosamine kinase-like BadF-type ATPase